MSGFSLQMSETIYGNIQGLKASYIKQLQRLYEQRQPGDRLTTPELAQQLTAISTEIHQPVCAYINRRGQVVRIAVGTPQETQMSPQELPRHGAQRLSGIRCLATQFKGAIPNTAALTAMARQRLDALVVLMPTDKGAERRDGNPTSSVKEAFLAHLVPDLESPWLVSPPLSLDELTEQDFDELVDEWESEFREAGFELSQFQQMKSEQDRVLLVGLMTEDMSPQRFPDSLAELTRLVESAGGEVLDTMQQKRRSYGAASLTQPHPQTVVGQGKVEEIALRAHQLGANLIVFNRDISPSQARNLETEIGIRVVDLSHPAWESHIRSVEEVLREMPTMPGPALIAFNKMDGVSSETLALAQQQYPEALFISATQRLGLETLRQRLVQLIDQVVSPVGVTQS